jgi:hypothetical protein
VLNARPQGEVWLSRLNGTELSKNCVPVGREGAPVGSQDTIQLGDLTLSYENDMEELF